MKTYPWPGNVRALRHAVERAVILSETSNFEAIDLQLDTTQSITATNTLRPGNSGAHREEPAANHLGQEDLNLERLEMRAVQAALQQHRYNISKAPVWEHPRFAAAGPGDIW